MRIFPFVYLSLAITCAINYSSLFEYVKKKKKNVFIQSTLPYSFNLFVSIIRVFNIFMYLDWISIFFNFQFSSRL